MKTTDSNHEYPLYPDLAKDVIPTGAYRLWVNDITYIPIGQSPERRKFCYLSLITDYYSKEIVGWSIGDSLETKYPLKSLEMALGRFPKDEVPISSIIPTVAFSTPVTSTRQSSRITRSG